MVSKEEIKENLLKPFIDWSKFAVYNDHIWDKSSVKCRVCSISLELAKSQPCKPTFTTKDNAESFTEHFFVNASTSDRICLACGEGSKGCKAKTENINESQSNVTSQNNTNSSHSLVKCLWCQRIFHDSQKCLADLKNTNMGHCDFGYLSQHIIPPNMIQLKGNSDMENDSIKLRMSNNFSLVLPDELPANFSPIIVFANIKSGNHSSSILYEAFLRHLNPRQIFLIPQSDPTEVLNFYRKFEHLILLVCGGDGSISWISSVVASLDMTRKCSISPLPLGTGNDFCHSFNWGRVIANPKRFKFLRHVQEIRNAQLCNVDVWDIDLKKIEEDGTKTILPNVRNPTFINYLSIGADAAIAHEFDQKRNGNPEKYKNRNLNLITYATATTKYFFAQSYRKIYKKARIFCDHEEVTEKFRACDAQVILLLNIKSYAAGMEPWVTSGMNEFQKQATDDEMIEVIGLSLISLPMLAMKMSGHKIAQCKHVRIEINEPMHLQIDGEPYQVPKSEIKIQHRDQIKILKRAKSLKELASSSEIDFSATTNLSDADVKGSNSNVSELAAKDEVSNNENGQENFYQKLNMSYLFNLFNDQDTIHAIIQKYFRKDWTGEKSLIEAIKNKEHRTILYLLNSVKNLNLDYKDEEGKSPLHYAASSLDVYCLSLLLINGANPYLKSGKDGKGDSAIKMIKRHPKSTEILSYIKQVVS